jgi:7-carboxy-7-deazaguanine synthase
MVLYYGTMKVARLSEVFVSIQGEGPWIGERHIFVRFQGCDLRCRYCDTPAAMQAPPGRSVREFCNVQTSPIMPAVYERVPNPVPAVLLTGWCARLSIPGPSQSTISLTGGEPLLQHEFLAHWLPLVKQDHRVYLETNGILFDAMGAVANTVDIVSMDFKLPSATGLRPYWEEHERFLAAAVHARLFVKAVVTRDTLMEDILFSARLIAGRDGSIPLVIQPAGGPLAPEAKTLIDFQDAALGIIRDVRVIPQAHKTLKVP